MVEVTIGAFESLVTVDLPTGEAVIKCPWWWATLVAGAIDLMIGLWETLVVITGAAETLVVKAGAAITTGAVEILTWVGWTTVVV